MNSVEGIGSAGATVRTRFWGSGVLDAIVLVYFLSQLGNVLLTKLATSTVHRDAAGLAILPYTLLIYAALTYLFIWLSGWHRDAHATRIAGLRVPMPTRYTALSSVGSALMLSAVPMSYGLPDISIPFIMLLMRGGILVLAPIVDLYFGRRIRWWSYVGLAMVALALTLVMYQRGGLHLSPLATTTVLFYNLGYVLRVTVMTHVAKRGDPAQSRQYFVEERMLALPLSILALAALTMAGIGAPAEGFAGIIGVEWSAALFWNVFGVGLSLALVSIFAALILLGAQENSFCVPLERSGGLLAGFAAAWLLHWAWDMPAPTGTEMLGATILIAAIALLSVASHRDRGAN